MRRSFAAVFLGFLAVVATLFLLVHDADARGGKGGSLGSRGSRTYSAPPVTTTAPTAAPLQRTITQPGSAVAARPGAPAAAAAPGGMFSRPGLLGGLAAGFLGAGLIGMLMGNGFMGGLAGLASIFGLLIQVGLVVIVGVLLWRWWQRRSEPAVASGPSLREMTQDRPGLGGLGLGGMGATPAGTPAAAPVAQDIGVEPADYDAFERLLGDVQSAYGAEDLGRLRALVTAEMLSYFSEELTDNASRGEINQVSNVKLLQGDLAEAWREGEAEYASVAMRYALDDRRIERASGRVIEGGPQEVTEIWTFRRASGGNWILSAIQQS